MKLLDYLLTKNRYSIVKHRPASNSWKTFQEEFSCYLLTNSLLSPVVGLRLGGPLMTSSYSANHDKSFDQA